MMMDATCADMQDRHHEKTLLKLPNVWPRLKSLSIKCICMATLINGVRQTVMRVHFPSLIINNQVVRKIKIAVKSDVKNWAYISLR